MLHVIEAKNELKLLALEIKTELRQIGDELRNQNRELARENQVKFDAMIAELRAEISKKS